MPEWFQADASRTLVLIGFVVWCIVWWGIQDHFNRPKVPKWVTEFSKVVMLLLAFVAVYSVFSLELGEANHSIWFALSMLSLGPVWAIPTVIYKTTLGRTNPADDEPS